MSGKKGMKDYTSDFKEKVKKLSLEGKTHREIGKLLGCEKIQIKRLLERERVKANKIKAGILPSIKGRPRKSPKPMEIRIQELERENDLLRSFLQAAGRK